MSLARIYHLLFDLFLSIRLQTYLIRVRKEMNLQERIIAFTRICTIKRKLLQANDLQELMCPREDSNKKSME